MSICGVGLNNHLVYEPVKTRLLHILVQDFFITRVASIKMLVLF
nr:MAG TPA: hypothetical protein [Caudoviricetes sp.]